MPISDKDFKKAKPISYYLPEIFDVSADQVESKIMPWKRAIKQVELGQIDVMGPLVVDPRKEAYVVFTEPLMTRDMFLWFKNSNMATKKKTWNELSDLKPFTIAHVLGYYYGPDFENFLKLSDVKKIEVVDVAHGIKALEAGEADLFIGSKVIIEENVEKIGIQIESFGHMPKPVSKLSFVLGISKKSAWAKKVDELNKRVLKIRKSLEN